MKSNASRTTTGSGHDAKEPTSKEGQKFNEVRKNKLTFNRYRKTHLAHGLSPGLDQFLCISSIVIHSQSYLICSLSALKQHMQPTKPNRVNKQVELFVVSYKYNLNSVKMLTFRTSGGRSGVSLSSRKTLNLRTASFMVASWPSSARAVKSVPLNKAFKWPSPLLASQPSFLQTISQMLGKISSIKRSSNNIEIYLLRKRLKEVN